MPQPHRRQGVAQDNLYVAPGMKQCAYIPNRAPRFVSHKVQPICVSNSCSVLLGWYVHLIYEILSPPGACVLRTDFFCTKIEIVKNQLLSILGVQLLC